MVNSRYVFLLNSFRIVFCWPYSLPTPLWGSSAICFKITCVSFCMVLLSPGPLFLRLYPQNQKTWFFFTKPSWFLVPVSCFFLSHRGVTPLRYHLTLFYSHLLIKTLIFGHDASFLSSFFVTHVSIVLQIFLDPLDSYLSSPLLVPLL